MELVSPAPEAPEQNTEETIEAPERQYTTEPEIVSQTPQQATTPATKTSLNETIIEIESALYIAKVSSMAGGTITEFSTKGYLTADSQLVNLILPNQSPNLLLQAKDLDGNNLDLESPWEFISSQPPNIIKEPFVLELNYLFLFN